MGTKKSKRAVLGREDIQHACGSCLAESFLPYVGTYSCKPYVCFLFSGLGFTSGDFRGLGLTGFSGSGFSYFAWGFSKSDARRAFRLVIWARAQGKNVFPSQTRSWPQLAVARFTLWIEP